MVGLASPFHSKWAGGGAHVVLMLTGAMATNLFGINLARIAEPSDLTWGRWVVMA